MSDELSGSETAERDDRNGDIKSRTILLGMILPPHYIMSFVLGGIIRWYPNRRYGKEFYNVKGRLIVTGLMASSLIVQVVMTVLTNFV